MILPVAGAPPTLECTWQEGRVEKSAGNQTTCSQPQQIFMSIAELVFTIGATVVYFNTFVTSFLVVLGFNYFRNVTVAHELQDSNFIEGNCENPGKEEPVLIGPHFCL